MLAHQRKLDVIANNIANVNTTGFRSQRAMFQDLFYQTLQGARGPVPGFGGTNPMQVGLGVQIGSIDTDYSQASLITTGVSSDLNGFLCSERRRGKLLHPRWVVHRQCQWAADRAGHGAVRAGLPG